VLQLQHLEVGVPGKKTVLLTEPDLMASIRTSRRIKEQNTKVLLKIMASFFYAGSTLFVL